MENKFNFDLKICGDGKKNEIINIKNKNNLNKVLFKSKLSYEKVQKKNRKFKINYSSIKWFEPFGLIITEALSKGTPVAVSYIGIWDHDLIKI